MNELEMDEILQWWSLKSTSPHLTKEEKQHWQDKLNKVMKLVEELNKDEIKTSKR
jgi:Asp-tRNA(Asn)/Glu-tRNA(Gln) amidotransferase C subunit